MNWKMDLLTNRKSLALPTAIILILSILAALPILPAHAALGTVTLSSDKMYDGKMIQITVTDSDIAEKGAPPPSLKAVWKGYEITLGTYQAIGGSWVCWIVANNVTSVQPSNPPPDIDGKSMVGKCLPYTHEIKWGALKPSVTDEIKIVYYDASEMVEVTSTITYTYTEGSISLDRSTIPLNAILRVTVVDPDLNLDPTAINETTAKVVEIYVKGGVYADYVKIAELTVKETGPNTETFKTSFDFATTDKEAINSDVKVVYKDSAPSKDIEKHALVIATTAEISLDKDEYVVNETAVITLIEPDLNIDTASKQKVTVTAKSKKTADSEFIELKETGKSTGIFEGKLKFAIHEVTDTTKLNVTAGDTITVTYTDPVIATGEKNVERSDTASFKTHTGILETDKDVYAPAMYVTVKVTDPDRNVLTGVREFLGTPADKSDVTVKGADGKTVGVLMTETAENTGVFEGKFKIVLTKTEQKDIPDVKAELGKSLTIVYKDPVNEEGKVKEVKKTITVRGTTGSTELGRSKYSPIVKVLVRITDPDLNLDPYSKDKITVTKTGPSDKPWELKVSGTSIFNHTDPEVVLYSTDWNGTVISDLEETGVDTSIFEKVVSKHIGIVKAGETLYFRYIDPANSAGATQTIEASASLDTTTGTLELDKSIYKVNEYVAATVVDPDMNKDPKAKDTITGRLTVKSDTAPGGVSVDLTETGKDTDTFTGKIKITLTGAAGELKVKRGDTITVTYKDEETSGGGGTIKVTKTARVFSADGSIALDKSVYSPRSKVKITVTDPDENINSNAIDTITGKVRVYTTSDPSGITIDVTETDVDTGVFTATIKLAETTSGMNLKATHGDGLTAVYTEEADAAGNKDVARRVSASISYQTATMTFDKNIYLMTDTATITLNEPDKNLDPSLKESVTVTVTSTSDSAGIRVTLIETDVDTGIFNGTFTFTSGTSVGTMLQAKKGDTIKAIYRDYSPSEYPTPESVLVTAEATIGVPYIEKPITAGTPALKDPTTGEVLTKGEVGKTVMLSTEMENTSEEDQEMLYIVQVKDATGRVVYISFISGTVPALKTYTFGIGWTPEEPGTYTIEVFAWRSWAEPTPLSTVTTTTITVE